PLRAAAGRARGRRDARPRLARPPRGVGVPHVGRGRLQGVRGVHDAPLLRGALPPAGRVVARLDGPRVDARYGGGRPRARPPLPRERGERRPAPRPRPTRGVRALGRRAWSDRHQAGAIRRRRRPAQDRRWRPAAVPRRSPRMGRLIGASALREDLALAALLSVSAIGLAPAPFLWVTGEWVRARLLGGFPWGTLGYSQYLRLPVIQIAELGGVHAVSFVLVAVNTAVAGCLVLPWRGALAGAALAGTLLAATLAFGSARLAEPARPGEVTVAIVQPSIEQPLKFDPT